MQLRDQDAAEGPGISLGTRTQLRGSLPCNNVCASSRVEPRRSCLDIHLHHEPPCLVNEFYQVTIEAVNKEAVRITNVQLTVGLKEGQDVHLDQSSEYDQPIIS